MDGCPQNSDSWRTLWPFLHLPHGPFAAWLRGNRSKITGARLGTQIAVVDQVEDSTLKMSARVSTLFVAGLIGLACSSSGLKARGSSAGAGSVANGGQAGSGAVGGAGGTVGAGGVGAGDAGGGTGGTCLSNFCIMPLCAGEFQPNPDPCGCDICVPSPDAGVTKDGGPDVCLAISCAATICPEGYQLEPQRCGCPICVPMSDAGIAKDGGGPDLPACPEQVDCLFNCSTGYEPNPDPCGCPICAPPPDASMAKDAGTRTPLLHRSVGATCPTGRGHGSGPFVDSCSATTCPAYHCVQDLNCTAGTNGRCLTGNPGGLALCSYDECFSDADCPANIPCECRDSASSSAPNSCLAGSDCRVDSDCGPGNFCSPSPAWVNAPYHCHTSSDTCMDDSDCMPLKSCAFDGQNGYWSCVVLPPPPT
jgi:hypothetical protein